MNLPLMRQSFLVEGSGLRALSAMLLGMSVATGGWFPQGISIPLSHPVSRTTQEETHSELRSHRDRELKFRAGHPELFRPLVGQWACVEGETIVAHAVDLVEVVAMARQKGVPIPYVFKVVGEEEGIVAIGL